MGKNSALKQKNNLAIHNIEDICLSGVRWKDAHWPYMWDSEVYKVATKGQWQHNEKAHYG